MPEASWKPERIASDLQLSRKLVKKLDEELGVADSPFAPAAPDTAQPAASEALADTLTLHAFVKLCKLVKKLNEEQGGHGPFAPAPLDAARLDSCMYAARRVCSSTGVSHVCMHLLLVASAGTSEYGLKLMLRWLQVQRLWRQTLQSQPQSLWRQLTQPWLLHSWPPRSWLSLQK